MQQIGPEPQKANNFGPYTVVDHPLGAVVEVGLKLYAGLAVSEVAQSASSTGPVRLTVTRRDNLPAISHRYTMQVTGLTDVSDSLLMVRAGLSAVVKQQDTTTLRTGLALVGEPVRHLVSERLTLCQHVRGTEVLDRSKRRVTQDHRNTEFLSYLPDDGGLTAARRAEDDDGTLDREQSLERSLEKFCTHRYVSLC